MNRCYLFDYFKNVEIPGKGTQIQNHLVIFFAYKEILANRLDIEIQLRTYFFSNTLPDRLIIICLDYNKVDIQQLFAAESSIFDFIPRFKHDQTLDNMVIISAGLQGLLNVELGTISEEQIREIYNRGLTKIFVDNGGLIISRSAHHFVFPSGKHCDRFLRTGNVLLHGAQITFIASALLTHFKNRMPSHIYCDTSSINSLAYAFINLRRDLGDISRYSVHIESFGSYRLFEKHAFKAQRNSVFLISSSTSGSILRRMSTDKGKNISVDDIAVIYGLGVESSYKPQVICDLQRHVESNPQGVSAFNSFNVKNGVPCALCMNKSVPITVEGDVFLLEKPAIATYLIKKSDLPGFMNKFSDYYRVDPQSSALIRCFYKENARQGKKYEIFIDIEQLAQTWLSHSTGPMPYRKLFEKFEKSVLQSFPASLKYIISLQDKGSQTLSQLIVMILVKNGMSIDDSKILQLDNFQKEIVKSIPGVIAVVSSSIVTGRNLLFLSRSLRDFENDFQRMYFTFLNRSSRIEFFDFLESNLGLGENGPGTHKITNVERIFCSFEAIQTSWHIEIEFLNKLEEFCDEQSMYPSTLAYCKERKQVLEGSGKTKGLDSNLFHPSFSGNALQINNGFAFAPPAKDFTITAAQSEVYFIVSNILNDLRNKNVLQQTEYVRNLLDPGNFVRYNDGIIQASLLRAAKDDELKFHLSDELSLQIKSVIGDMILHLHDKHSEAILEFFYSIAIKKLRLLDNDLRDCVSLLEAQAIYQVDSVLLGMVEYVKCHQFGPKDIPKVFEDLPKLIVEEDTDLEQNP